MRVNILLCDDEAIQRAALRAALTQLTGLPLAIGGVREAKHGREALAMIAASQPHIVFLDLRMPVLGGLETAAIMRKQYPDIKIIILTAYDEFNFAQEALKLGVSDYLLKPASNSDIAQVLTKVMQELLIRSERASWLASLQQRVEEAKPYIQLEYIDDLLGLARLDKTAIEEKRDFLGLARHPELVMLLEFDDFALAAGASEEERQARKEEVRALIWQQAASYAPLFVRMGGDRFCLLFPAPNATMDEQACAKWAVSLAERLRCVISCNTGLKLTIGIGRRYTDPLHLQKSLHEAQVAVSYKFILGDNHTIHIDDIELGPADDASKELQQLQEDVLISLRLGDAKEFVNGLRQLVDLLCCSRIESLASARWSFLQLFVALAGAANIGGAESAALTTTSLHYMRLLQNAETLAMLRDTLLRAGAELNELVSQVHNLRHYKLVERAKNYMAEHFTEPLQLDDVAGTIYLSPHYFSHVFKEQTGMTFIEYLTHLRIREAKKMLRETTLPVGHIALQVGYNDINYFSRVFKKEVGLTATQFRDSTS